MICNQFLFNLCQFARKGTAFSRDAQILESKPAYFAPYFTPYFCKKNVLRKGRLFARQGRVIFRKACLVFVAERALVGPIIVALLHCNNTPKNLKSLILSIIQFLPVFTATILRYLECCIVAVQQCNNFNSTFSRAKPWVSRVSRWVLFARRGIQNYRSVEVCTLKEDTKDRYCLDKIAEVTLRDRHLSRETMPQG